MIGDEALWLRIAIDRAMNGRGRVEPNPMVGCVLARDGVVLGEGFHAQFGGPHAEPSALADAQARGHDPRGATAVVTLEPCCHEDKKTPPCAPRLIEAGIARVVIGCPDPNPSVNGRGIAMLRDAGITVVEASQPLADQCRQLIAPFIARTVHRRPYVTLKWAQTADGRVAGGRGQPVRITTPGADRIVHALRARSGAIGVGGNTVRQDDPLLTVRHAPILSRAPLRVVFSNQLALPPDARLVRTTDQAPLLVYCTQATADALPDRVATLRAAGVEVVALPGRPRFDFRDAFRDLCERGVADLLIEPGPVLARCLFQENWVDRVWVFRSARTLRDLIVEFPDPHDPAVNVAPAVPFPATATTRIDPAIELSEHLNPGSAVFFAAEPSVDFRTLVADRSSGERST